MSATLLNEYGMVWYRQKNKIKDKTKRDVQTGAVPTLKRYIDACSSFGPV